MKKINKLYFILVSVSLCFIVYGVGLQRDIRGKAAQVVLLKNGLLPTLRVILLHPVQAGKPVDVGVYVNTAGLETAEADVVFSYDPKILLLEDSDIELLPEFRTMNIEHPELGTVVVNVFTSDSTSTHFVSSTTDLPIAVLHFHPISKADTAQIQLVFDHTQADTSGLYPPRGEAGGVVNILSSVNTLSVKLQ